MSYRKKSDPFRLLVFLSILFIFFSCKKDSGKSEDEFYLSATISGKSWQSNQTSTQGFHTGAILANGYVVVTGVQVVNKDTTVLAITVPATVTEGTTMKFDKNANCVVLYLMNGSDMYTNNEYQPSGTITVTRIDDSNNIIEGNFSCETLLRTNNSVKMNITGGKFRAEVF